MGLLVAEEQILEEIGENGLRKSKKFLYDLLLAFLHKLRNEISIDLVLNRQVFQAWKDVEIYDAPRVQFEHGYPVLLLTFVCYNFFIGNTFDHCPHQIAFIAKHVELIQCLEAASTVQLFKDVFEESNRLLAH